MFKRIASIIFIILVGGAGVFAFNNQQEIRDQITVSQAQIDPAVTQLVVNSGMNDRGIFIFHAATPRLESPDGFNQSCTRKEERSAILGCYVNDTIHIFDIQDERLAGVKEVTATHEGLHAIFARTSESEQDRLITLLEAEYDRIVATEPELVERMAYYDRTQPGQRTNELHSIIGTEYLGISKELEDYYRTYFEDRSKVVAQHERYKHRFDELRGEAARLETELQQLSDQINSMTEQYDNAANNLSQRIDEFNSRAQSSYFTSQAQFDGERNSLIEESNRLEAYRVSVNDTIALYEQKRLEFNENASESNSMYKSLDSKSEPTPRI